MSIDAIRPRDTSQQDRGDEQPVATRDHETKLPDFSAAIFSAVHLPTGLIAHTSSTSLSTLRADLADLKTKFETLARDLKSPEIVNYAKTGAGVYSAYVKVNLCVGKLAAALYALDKGDTKEFLSALKEGFDIPSKVHALVEAHREFAKANGPKTGAAFGKLAQDFVELDKSQAKLLADTAKAVTP